MIIGINLLVAISDRFLVPCWERWNQHPHLSHDLLSFQLVIFILIALFLMTVYDTHLLFCKPNPYNCLPSSAYLNWLEVHRFFGCPDFIMNCLFVFSPRRAHGCVPEVPPSLRVFTKCIPGVSHFSSYTFFPPRPAASWSYEVDACCRSLKQAALLLLINNFLFHPKCLKESVSLKFITLLRNTCGAFCSSLSEVWHAVLNLGSTNCFISRSLTPSLHNL